MNRHKWQYTSGNNYPRKCVKCGVKEISKLRPSKKGPGKVAQVFHLGCAKELIEGNAPACTIE